MKVLLAVTGSNNPAETVRYLSERFGRQQMDIDILTAIPGEELFDEHSVSRNQLAECRRENERACKLVADIEKRLRANTRFRSIRTFVEYGEPAQVILDFSRQLRSDLLLIGAPRRHGLLTAFRIDGVTRRLLNWSECPVELFRNADEQSVRKRILVPVLFNAANEFEVPEIRQLGWSPGTHLHLLGILPAVMEDNRIEANPAAMLLRIQECQDRWGVAKAAFARLCEKFGQSLPESVSLSHELQAGKAKEVLVQTAGELLPSMVVLDQNWSGDAGRSLFASLAPMSVVMSLPCSVIHIGQHQQSLEALEFSRSSGLAH